jgi:hypothetical protein
MELDNISEETLELLEPYLNLTTSDGRKLFRGDVARMASAALAGLVEYIREVDLYVKH